MSVFLVGLVILAGIMAIVLIEVVYDFKWAVTQRGWTHREAGRLAKALADFNRAIHLNPQYKWAVAGRALIERLMRRYDAALIDFNHAISLDPNCSWCLANRAETYRLLTQYEAALADFNQAIALNLSYKWAIASRGQLYRLMVHYDEALQDLNYALALDPNCSWCLANRGEVYCLMGLYDQALADFNRAIQRFPNYKWAIANRAKTYQLMGRYEEALRDFSAALRLEPDCEWCLISRNALSQLAQPVQLSLPPQPSPSLAVPRPAQVSPSRTLLGVIVPVLGLLLVTLDQQMTTAALKDIQGALGFSADEATWVTIAYTSAQLTMIPLAGWLHRAFSRRWFLSVSAISFVVLSLMTMVAWNLPSFLVCRTLQGLVAGAFVVSAFTIVMTQMPRFKQHLGLMMIGITASLPLPIAQLLTGWLVDNANWQWICGLNVPCGILLFFGLRYWLDPQPKQLSVLKQIDWLGCSVLMVSMVCLTSILQRGNIENWFDSSWILHLSLIALLSLVLFCWIETHQTQPLINLSLLRQRNFGLINLLNLAIGLVLAYTYVLPQYLGQIQGYNAMQIGGVLLWGTVINPTVPKLVEHLEARLLLGIGLGIYVISCFMNTTLSYYYSGEQFVLSQVVRAIAQPIILVAISYIATSEVQQQDADSVAAIFNQIRVIAGSLGTSILGTFLTHREQFHSNRLIEDITISNLQTQDRLQQLTQFFITKLGDPAVAQMQAVAAINQTVRRESFIMAYSDAFHFIGMGLLVSGIIIVLLKRSKKPAESQYG